VVQKFSSFPPQVLQKTSKNFSTKIALKMVDLRVFEAEFGPPHKANFEFETLKSDSTELNQILAPSLYRLGMISGRLSR
jgi:hypothetical protein